MAAPAIQPDVYASAAPHTPVGGLLCCSAFAAGSASPFPALRSGDDVLKAMLDLGVKQREAKQAEQNAYGIHFHGLAQPCWPKSDATDSLATEAANLKNVELTRLTFIGT